jgi:hypothetical protein
MGLTKQGVKNRNKNTTGGTLGPSGVTQGVTHDGIGTIVVPLTLLDVVGDELIQTHRDITMADARIFRAAVRNLIDWRDANKAVWLLEQMGRALERETNQKVLEARSNDPFVGIQFVPASQAAAVVAATVLPPKVLTDPVEEAHVDNLIANGGDDADPS